jgi:hypothetical protein
LAEVVLTDDVIVNRIGRAKLLFDHHGDGLQTDHVIGSLLAAYRESLQQTGAAMRSEGIGAACSECAGKTPSGCCFVGIEDGYDEILLLLNLLLGCPLPESRQDPGSCFFVGTAGCKLVARYYFCLHYFCSDLKESLGDRRIKALQQQVARELNAGWQLEGAVRSWLRDRHPELRQEESQ